MQVIKALCWKLMERFGVQGAQFVLQIVLARLLTPEHYGILSLMAVFTTLANVFVQNGFNTALIQSKDVDDDDYSSVFWVSLLIACGIYTILYLCAPLIASFYDMPDIIRPFRVLAFMLIPGALNSVQLAKVTRDLQFKNVFYSNIGGIVIAGLVSILLAYFGAGIWALVVQNLLNVTISCIVMLIAVKWIPRPIINWKRVMILFNFGWKLIVSSVLSTIYDNLRSLVVGKRYDEETLGYYNRGKQFPEFIINAINGAIQSVMLPVMAKKQDEKLHAKEFMRISMTLSAYIIFPMMAGLAAVASPLVSILLTEKWLPCVPYMQIYCFTLAFYPVHTCNLQTINAMGRSDMFLKLEIIKKAYGIIALVLAVIFFDSPIAIAMTGVITTLISCFVNAAPNKKLIDYSYAEQMKDILPSFILSLVMFLVVYAIGLLNFGYILTMATQIIFGVVFYAALSHLLRLQPYIFLINIIKGNRKKSSRT